MKSRWEFIGILVLVWISIEVVVLSYGAGIYMGLEHSDWKGIVGIDRWSQQAAVHYMKVARKGPSLEQLKARWEEDIYKMPFDEQIKMMLFIWQYVR